MAAGVGWLCEGVPELPDCEVEAPWGVLPVLDWLGPEGVWLRLFVSSMTCGKTERRPSDAAGAMERISQTAERATRAQLAWYRWPG